MKRIKKIAISCAFAFVCMASLGIGTKAYEAVKSYCYDDNIYYGATNFHNYQYVELPRDAYFTDSSEIRINSEWNYTRYQVINYYYSPTEGDL